MTNLTHQSDDLLDELYDLCEFVLEGELTAEQQARLEELVLSDAALCQAYVEYMHTNATLTWWGGVEPASRPLPAAPVMVAEETPAQPAPAARPARAPQGSGGVIGWWMAASQALADWHRQLTWQQAMPYLVSGAVMLMIGVVLGVTYMPSPGGAPHRVAMVATLDQAKDCRWENTLLPTMPGARLPAGKLRLAEGLAQLTFDDGAKVVLEAPAELELVSSGACFLHKGKLVASVPQPAVGFVVDTPVARVVDLGTEFGVDVKGPELTDVQVFAGAVELEHRPTGQKQRLSYGDAKRLDKSGSRNFDPLVIEAGQVVVPAAGPPQETRLVNISTADGAGKDAWVQSSPKDAGASETLLLVKNSMGPTHSRKAYVTFDLSAVGKAEIDDARVVFTVLPSELGFASATPDSTFTLYGLLDESRDGWDEATINWSNAPANLRRGAEIDLAHAVKIGSFVVDQGVRSGIRAVSGPALVDFLKRDTNGLVTFILARDTPESRGGGLVHAFASKRHPSADPPTLKLVVREDMP